MHIVTVLSTLMPGSKHELPVGTYVVDNILAGQLLSRHQDELVASPFRNHKPLPNLPWSDDRRPKDILLIRAGGFGDLLFLAAAIRVWKKIYPDSRVSVATFSTYHDALLHNPDITEIVPYPIPVGKLDDYDTIVPLENVIESEHKLHAVDRFLEALHIPHDGVPDEEKRCVYHLTEKERIGATTMFAPRANTPRLGVQVIASSRSRTYSHDLLEQAVSLLHRKGWEIYFFGPPHSILIAEEDRVVNLSLRGFNFRQSAAVLSTCDVVLAPDSALCHLAGALDLPTVALYGPFPYQIRTKYHPKTFALSGKGPCAPCFHHDRGQRPFPANGPCHTSGRCDVLASIEPQRVASKVAALHRAAVNLSEHRNQGKL